MSCKQTESSIQVNQEWSLPAGASDPVLDIIAQRILELELRELSGQGLALSDNQVAKLLDLVVRFPASCQRSYQVALKDGRMGQQYALSSILKLQPPLHLVQCVVQASPSAVYATAADGFRPLDTACWKNASVEVVEYLHHCNTTAISTQCKGVMHPLHISLSHFKSASSESVVNFLLQQYPEASRLRDANGKYPLHHAASSGASTTVLERLVALCPESTTAVDQHGYTPLHSACRRRSENAEHVVEFLKAEASQTVSMPNQNGNTPLDLAAMYQTPLVIASLSAANNGACQQQLLHLAARSNQSDAVEALARQCSVSHSDPVPLQLACQRTDDPVDVVRVLLRTNPAALMAKNARGQLPLELLATKSNRRTARLLKMKMAAAR